MKDIFKNYQTILFQGDSVTDCGRNKDSFTDLACGYVSMLAADYKAAFPSFDKQILNRGWTGNSLINLLDRYERDILALKPDFLSVMIGINNVWRHFDRNITTTQKAFAEQYEELLQRVKADLPECRILLIDPFFMQCTEEQLLWRPYLEEYKAVIAELAAKYTDWHLPLDDIINNSGFSALEMTRDGVHPLENGHRFIADEIIHILS